MYYSGYQKKHTRYREQDTVVSAEWEQKNNHAENKVALLATRKGVHGNLYLCTSDREESLSSDLQRSVVESARGKNTDIRRVKSAPMIGDTETSP